MKDLVAATFSAGASPDAIVQSGSRHLADRNEDVSQTLTIGFFDDLCFQLSCSTDLILAIVNAQGLARSDLLILPRMDIFPIAVEQDQGQSRLTAIICFCQSAERQMPLSYIASLSCRCAFKIQFRCTAALYWYIYCLNERLVLSTVDQVRQVPLASIYCGNVEEINIGSNWKAAVADGESAKLGYWVEGKSPEPRTQQDVTDHSSRDVSLGLCSEKSELAIITARLSVSCIPVFGPKSLLNTPLGSPETERLVQTRRAHHQT